MAEGNKTEKATPKKRRDERKKGNVFLSKDAIAVVSLFSTFFLLRILAGYMVTQINYFLHLCMDYAAITAVGQASEVIRKVMTEGVLVLAKVAGPMLGIACIAAVGTTLFQTKMLVAPESIKPKLNKISPIQGFKRLFSLKSVVEALKGLIKITILLVIIYFYLSGMINTFFNYLNTDLGWACSDLFQKIFAMVLQILVAFLVLAGFDYIYQWWEYERKLKMTKQEIKDEYKQTEGDPKIKAKIKENQRKMAQSRMMQSVPGADVVVRNPQHVAVALRYNPETDYAPVVLAMGLDHLALKIVEVAEAHKVPTVENVPLARELYATSEIGQPISPELYGAVADVMVYLYRIGAQKNPIKQ